LAAAPTNGNQRAVAEAVEAKAKRMNPMKRKQMEDRLHELEREIAQTEAAIAQCETQLQNFVSADETQRVGQELSKSKGNLQRLMKEWEELSGILETTA